MARMTTALLESETKPESVLDRRFRKSVYGNYPLANSPTVQSIANISVELHLQIRGIREELSGGWTIIESWANPVRLEDCQDLILPRRNVEVRRDMSGLQLW